MKNKAEAIKIILVGLVMLAGTGAYLYSANTVANLTIKVEDKQVLPSRDSSQFLIFTKNETLSMNDSVIALNFDSSDHFHKMKKEKCYDVKVRGVRVGLLSLYRNIEEYEEVKCL